MSYHRKWMVNGSAITLSDLFGTRIIQETVDIMFVTQESRLHTYNITGKK